MTESTTATSGAETLSAATDLAALPFDKALEQLQEVVSRLEAGNLPLEESIALYERGAALHEHCGRLLDAAELRVQRLIDSGAGASPGVVDLRPDDLEDL